jgi:hypothetical protein
MNDVQTPRDVDYYSACTGITNRTNDVLLQQPVEPGLPDGRWVIPDSYVLKLVGANLVSRTTVSIEQALMLFSGHDKWLLRLILRVQRRLPSADTFSGHNKWQ